MHDLSLHLLDSSGILEASGRGFLKIDSESRRGDNLINPYPTDVVVVVVVVIFLFPTTTYIEIYYKNTIPFAKINTIGVNMGG